LCSAQRDKSGQSPRHHPWLARFRAENSNATRRLAEFWLIGLEIAFADLSDNAALAKHWQSGANLPWTTKSRLRSPL
jgi:hypothetical protein